MGTKLVGGNFAPAVEISFLYVTHNSLRRKLTTMLIKSVSRSSVPGAIGRRRTCGITNDQFRRDLAVPCQALTLLNGSSNQVFDNFGTQRALNFQLLLNSRQRGIVESRAGEIIKANDRAVFRNSASSFGQGANGSAGGQIVESY